jgi:hypothetical protein
MSEDLDKIKEKIMSLMSKTTENGASEAEANSAMIIAIKLSEQYGINMENIKQRTVSGEFVLRKFNEGAKNLSVVAKNLPWSIAYFTDTKTFVSTSQTGRGGGFKRAKKKTEKSAMFYGYSVDVELAEYIYKVCERAVHQEWLNFAKRGVVGERAHKRVDFQVGMCLRLCERLEALKKSNTAKTNGTELVLLKTEIIQRAFEENVAKELAPAKESVTKYKDSFAYIAGMMAADSVDFMKQMESGEPEKRQNMLLLTSQ